MHVNRFIAQLMALGTAAPNPGGYARMIQEPGPGKGGSKNKGNARMAKGTKSKLLPQASIGASKFFRRGGCAHV